MLSHREARTRRRWTDAWSCMNQVNGPFVFCVHWFTAPTPRTWDLGGELLKNSSSGCVTFVKWLWKVSRFNAPLCFCQLPTSPVSSHIVFAAVNFVSCEEKVLLSELSRLRRGVWVLTGMHTRVQGGQWNRPCRLRVGDRHDVMSWTTDAQTPHYFTSLFQRPRFKFGHSLQCMIYLWCVCDLGHQYWGWVLYIRRT